MSYLWDANIPSRVNQRLEPVVGYHAGRCKRAKLAPARCGLLPPQPGDDQNRRLARVVGQLGQAVSPYTATIPGWWLTAQG